jgi:hypothetical protein
VMTKEELKRYKRLWARKKRAMGGPVPISRWQRVVGQYLPNLKRWTRGISAGLVS